MAHLRMCPGAERWLRPRWLTACTIILPVQLTLPCDRKRERKRERAHEVMTHHKQQCDSEEEIKCECESCKKLSESLYNMDS